MTESAKTGLICTKYTYSFYHVYLFFCVGYTISVSFIEFLRKFCVYDKIFDKVLCYEKELLNLQCSKLGQILCADKTGFRRLGHKLCQHIRRKPISCTAHPVNQHQYFRSLDQVASNTRPLKWDASQLPNISHAQLSTIHRYYSSVS